MLIDTLKDKCFLAPVETINYESIPKQGQKAIIIDDFMCENKKVLQQIEKISIMTRHIFATTFYLVQNYFSLKILLLEEMQVI